MCTILGDSVSRIQTPILEYIREPEKEDSKEDVRHFEIYNLLPLSCVYTRCRLGV
jgi:hypothetical protein